MSTDARFWFFLAPFLAASVVVWTYGVSWVLKEAPTAIPRLVASWQSVVGGDGDVTHRTAEELSTSDSTGMRHQGTPLLEVDQQKGLLLLQPLVGGFDSAHRNPIQHQSLRASGEHLENPL